MSREGHGGIYKAQQRKKEESERLRGEGEIRSSLLILDLKESKLYDPGKEEGKMFHKLYVFWDAKNMRHQCRKVDRYVSYFDDSF